jgi:hypothetical protein
MPYAKVGLHKLNQNENHTKYYDCMLGSGEFHILKWGRC